jgi:phosphohistidine phosphatase
MELYLLRHAPAEPQSVANARTDHERSLTSDGKRKMRRIAKGMKALDLSFDLILSSPFLRAKQTAQIVAEAFQLTEALELAPALASGQNSRNLIGSLQQRGELLKSALLVGHEPDLSALLSLLISGNPSLSITFKKGGLAKLTIAELRQGRCATLEWLLAPSQLIRIG